MSFKNNRFRFHLRGRQVEYTAWQILSGKGNEASNKRLCEENVVEVNSNLKFKII